MTLAWKVAKDMVTAVLAAVILFYALGWATLIGPGAYLWLAGMTYLSAVLNIVAGGAFAIAREHLGPLLEGKRIIGPATAPGRPSLPTARPSNAPATRRRSARRRPRPRAS